MTQAFNIWFGLAILTGVAYLCAKSGSPKKLRVAYDHREIEACIPLTIFAGVIIMKTSTAQSQWCIALVQAIVLAGTIWVATTIHIRSKPS